MFDFQEEKNEKKSCFLVFDGRIFVETKKDMKTAARIVTLYKMENGVYWIRDKKTGELIDGDRRLYVVKDMARRWGFIVVKK